MYTLYHTAPLCPQKNQRTMFRLFPDRSHTYHPAGPFFLYPFFSVENILCVLSDLVLKSSSNEADQVNDTQGSILSATWASLTVFLLFFLFCFPFSFSFIVSFYTLHLAWKTIGWKPYSYRDVWAHRSSALIDSEIITTFSSGAELNSVREKIKKGSHSQDFLLYIFRSFSKIIRNNRPLDFWTFILADTKSCEILIPKLDWPRKIIRTIRTV